MKPGLTKRPRRSTTSVPLPASLRIASLAPISRIVEPRIASAWASGWLGSPVQMRPFTNTRSARPVFALPVLPARSGAPAASHAAAATSAALPIRLIAAGPSVSTWTGGPGRNGVASPFTHAAWPSA